MQEPYWWYVLYVKANTEHRVVEEIQKYAISHIENEYGFVAFCPECERYYRNAKKHTPGRVYLKRPLFPNYVFVETDMPNIEFLNVFADYIYNSTDVIRVLRNGNSDDIAITTEERKRFEYLFKGIRYVEHSKGIIVGDQIKVTHGPLVGMEGCIKRIDRHNRDAEIEIEMFGQKTNIKVALEIVHKIQC